MHLAGFGFLCFTVQKQAVDFDSQNHFHWNAAGRELADGVLARPSTSNEGGNFRKTLVKSEEFRMN